MKNKIGNISLSSISKDLNRSIDSIKMKMFRLEIKGTKNQCTSITARQLSIYLGVVPSTIHYWIKHKKLKSQAKVLNTKEKYKLIEIEDFWKWAESNKHILNFSKLEKNVLPPEPRWVEELRKQHYYKPKNKNKHWSNKDIEHLLQYYYKGKSIKEIANVLNRTERGVYNKITNLHKK